LDLFLHPEKTTTEGEEHRSFIPSHPVPISSVLNKEEENKQQ